MWLFPLVAVAWECSAAEVGGVEARVEALLAQGRRREAEIAARAWAADEPAKVEAWLLLARIEADPDRARRFVEHALELAPDHPRALLEKGRLLHARGASRDAIPPLEAASEAGLAEASLLLARARRVLGDREAAIRDARRAVQQDPDLSEGWLFLARIDGPGVLDEGLSALPDDPDLNAARAAEHLRTGELDAAEGALARALRADPAHAEASRLGALAACLRAGTLDRAGFAALEQARRAALRGGAYPLTDRVAERYPGCGVTWLVRAAERAGEGDDEGALADLGHAVALLPDDPHATAAYGLALHEAGRHAEALRWLSVASGLRPSDVELQVARAESAVEVGQPAEARTAMEAVLAKTSRGQVATALPGVVRDEVAAFELLLRAVERDADLETVEVARELGRRLGRENEVTALLTMPRLPEFGGPGEGTSEEITVYAERESDRARARLEGRLEQMGYAPGMVRSDRTVFGAAPDRPALTLWHDGRIDMQSAGMLPGEMVGFEGLHVEPGAVVADFYTPKWYTKRRMSPKRYAVLDGARDAIRSWRDALAREGVANRAADELPRRLDALWREGVSLSGGEALATHAERRRALLAYWAGRTCDDFGWIVRDAVRAYLVAEVQPSPEPVTPAELEEANAATACGRLEL